MQEKGEIFFFYRPKVDKDEARGPDDVQRMYIVLRPESAAGDRAVEEKQAPDSGKEGRKHRPSGRAATVGPVRTRTTRAHGGACGEDGGPAAAEERAACLMHPSDRAELLLERALSEPSVIRIARVSDS